VFIGGIIVITYSTRSYNFPLKRESEKDAVGAYTR
jgi:hypothetical protein